MSDEWVERQLARLNALLSEERAGPGLTPAEPEWPAADLGAEQAAGFQTQKPDVRVTVYLYSESSKRREAAERLKALYRDDPVIYARTATNGPMLFFAHTRLEGRNPRDAEYRLDRILTAFSGDE